MLATIDDYDYIGSRVMKKVFHMAGCEGLGPSL